MMAEVLDRFGRVIESNLEKGRGAVVRLLVENGTLNLGDFVVAGSVWGSSSHGRPFFV